MDKEDGAVFIKNLAYYVRTHERALANALQVQTRPTRQPASGASSATSQPSSLNTNSAQQSSSSSSGVFASALPYLGLAPPPVKPAKLYLTPNQLYYLLSRFEDLGVSTGPMNVRLENIHADHTPSNYVSFLTQAQRPKGRSADQDSIHSVSSVRSVMSSVSSMWSSLSLGNSTAKLEKRKAAELEDLRYLYSAFTKIPCLKLALDHRVPRIADYEEFPFDTAVPLQAFKNVSTLEIVDLDFRTIYGWDRLADQLRSLTVKRACVEDLFDLLVNVVLDDADGRRKRSAKTHSSSTATPHAIPRLYTSDASDIARSSSVPDSPTAEQKSKSNARPVSADMSLANYNFARPALGPRLSSISPPRPSSSRRGSAYAPARPGGKIRQPSGGSMSSLVNHALAERQAARWRMLRHLSLADNALTSLSRQSLMPLTATLHSLDLSSNLFSEIPDTLAAMVSLRALNLANCMIESLHSLARSPLPAISVLNLRGNRIASLAGIERLLSLERLDLRENKIRDPTELARLTGMPNFQEVFVSRNPFTKTHGNYRTTIFNLFRHVPGYQEDVSVDGTGPTYNERRLLIDRAQEPVAAPVIQPPLDEDSTSTATTTTTALESKTTSYTSESADEAGRTATGVLSDDASVKSKNKRKGPKRRIVDIAQTDQSHRPSIVVNTPPEYTTAPPPLSSRHPSTSQSDTVSPVLSPIPGSPDPATKRQWLSEMDPTDPSLSGETYRRRVENLKKEYGASWLSALGDEGWQESTRAGAQAYAEKDYPASTSISPALSATSPPIVSSNRRLG